MLFLALAWTALAQPPAGEIPWRFPESLGVENLFRTRDLVGSTRRLVGRGPVCLP